MLETKLDTHILTQCLKYPTDSPAIVKASKQDILRSDYERLLLVSSTHPSAKHVATVAQSTSWSRLWDMALDHGIKGIQGLQLLLKMLSYRIFDHLCPSCGTTLVQDLSWFEHMCLDHPNAVNGFTSEEIICGLQSVDADLIFSVSSKLCTIVLIPYFYFCVYLPMPYGSHIIRTLRTLSRSRLFEPALSGERTGWAPLQR